MHVIPEWLELFSLAFCVGVIVCRLWFFTPSTQTKFGYQGNLVSGIWTLFYFGLALLTGCSIVELFTRTSEMSGQPFPALFSVLPTVLFRTHFGHVWLMRIAALTLLAMMKTLTRYRDTRIFLVFMLFLGLIVSMTMSASGHASDAGDFSVPEIADWLHLLAACLWGGGLIVLSVSVLPDLIGRAKGSAPLIARVANRFSSMAGIAVGIIALSALYNLWYYVRTAEALWKTPYGLTIIAKIILFFVLVNLGAFNRYVNVPLLREWAGGGAEGRTLIGRIALRLFERFFRNRDGRSTARRFRRSVGVEALLIIGALFCASLLRHEIPARHIAHMEHSHEMRAPHQHDGHSDHFDH